MELAHYQHLAHYNRWRINAVLSRLGRDSGTTDLVFMPTEEMA